MKKILTFIMVSLLLLSFSLAVVQEAPLKGQPEDAVAMPVLYGGPDADVPRPMLANHTGDNDSNADDMPVKAQIREENQIGEPIQKQLRNGSDMDMNKSVVRASLSKALMNVENEEARVAIQKNMDRFLEKYQNRLDKMDDVEVDSDEESGEVTIKAKEQVKYFGFIKGKATKSFNVESNGQVIERAPWYSFAYSETKSE